MCNHFIYVLFLDYILMETKASYKICKIVPQFDTVYKNHEFRAVFMHSFLLVLELRRYVAYIYDVFKDSLFPVEFVGCRLTVDEWTIYILYISIIYIIILRDINFPGLITADTDKGNRVFTF